LLSCIDFAIITQSHNATGLALAEIDLGYLPRMIFDWEARSRFPKDLRAKLSQKEAQAFAKQKAEAIRYARNNLIKA
jgi:hypothetical protein